MGISDDPNVEQYCIRSKYSTALESENAHQYKEIICAIVARMSQIDGLISLLMLICKKLDFKSGAYL